MIATNEEPIVPYTPVSICNCPLLRFLHYAHGCEAISSCDHNVDKNKRWEVSVVVAVEMRW